MKHFKLFIYTILVAFTCCGCYSFSGASIPPEIKTFSLDYFPNRATLINPTLSAELTDKLRSYISSRSSLLENTDGNADIDITGEISDYSVTPMAAQSDAQAALQRLSITVKVNFANNVNSKDNLSPSFTIYRDFDSALDLSDVEESLVAEILEEMVDDIFMAAFGNW